MRATNDNPLGCSLPLTGWHGKLRRNAEGTALIQQQAKWNAVHVYELKMTEAESPKLRNGHTMDLPLLFTMDEAHERQWMDGAVFGRSEGRGPGLDALASGMQQCWAHFCKTGTPGMLYKETADATAWPAYPAGIVLTSPKTREAGCLLPSNGPYVQNTCKYAPDSQEAMLWKATMEECGVHPLNRHPSEAPSSRCHVM